MTQPIAVKVFAASSEMDAEGRAFFQAKRVYDDALYPEAREQFLSLIREYPRSRFKMEMYFLLGQCALNQGDFDRARHYYRRVLISEVNPFQERSLYFLAQTYYESKIDPMVLVSMKKLAEKYPLSGYVGLARLTMGKSLRRMGEGEEAESLFSRIVFEYPKDLAGGWAQVEIAKMAQAKGNIEAVAEHLTEIAEERILNPLDAGQLELWYAKVLGRLGRHEESLGWYEKVLGEKLSARMLERAWVGKASALQRLGRLPEAAKAYQTFLDGYPESAFRGWSQIGLARLHLSIGNLKKAEEILEDVGHWGVEGQLQEVASFLRAQLQLQREGFGSAVGLFRQFLTQFPQSRYAALALFKVAFCHFYAGEYEKSLEASSLWLARGGERDLRHKVLLLKADAASLLRRWDQAADIYQEILREYPNDPKVDEVFHRLGYCFYQGRHWGLASNTLEKLVEGHPKSPWIASALSRLGTIRFDLGDFPKAAHYFHALVERFPESDYAEEAWYREGNSWYQLRQYEKALLSYQSLLKAYPKGTLQEMATEEMAWTYSSLGKETEAQEVFEGFLKKYPTSSLAPQALFWLGQRSLAQKRYSKAHDTFGKLFRKYPESDLADDALFCSGLALARSGKYKEAIGEMDALLHEYPASSLRRDALFVAADSEAARKHYAKAIAGFGRIAEEYPEDSRAAVARLRKADCYFARGDVAKAQEDYGKLLGNSDLDLRFQARFKRALCREQLGDEDGAKAEFLNLLYASEISSEWSSKAALKLGQLLEREQRWAEAMTVYGKIGKYSGNDSILALERIEQIKRGR